MARGRGLFTMQEQGLLLMACTFWFVMSAETAHAQDFTFFATRAVGNGSAIVRVDIIDPAVTTGDDYQVTFSIADEEVLYSIQNLSSLDIVLQNQHVEVPSPVFEGIQVTVTILPSQIRDVLEVSYGGNPVDPPVHVFRTGDREGEGGNNSTDDYAFIGGITGSFSDIAILEANANFDDFEIRFDGNPEGRNKYVYAFTATGTIDVPFSIWNLGHTPDDPSDDKQLIAVGFDHSGNFEAYDGGAAPADGGPGTMFDLIYGFDLANNPAADFNDDGVIDYDDFLQDLENNQGDVSSSFFARPYTNRATTQILSRLAMVALSGDPNEIPPVGTTIRIVTSEPLTENDIYEFSTPDFGLFSPVASIYFGNVRVGGSSAVMQLVLVNSSERAISISDIATTTDVFIPDITNFTIASGDTQFVPIRFAPSEAGILESEIIIISDDDFFPEYRLLLTGEGLPVREGAINIVGHLSIPPEGSVSDIWGYFDASANREYALVGGLSEIGVTIVDVTNPALPQIVTQVEDVPGFDVKTWGHYMYCVTGGGGTDAGKIVNIENPAAPEIVGSFDSSHNIFISDEGYMILSIPGLRVLDLNPDPTDPQLLLTRAILCC